MCCVRILAIQWIERGYGIVPTEFEVLVRKLIVEPELKEAIDNLLKAKRDSVELDYGPRIDSINEFIGRELKRFENYKVEYEKQPVAPLEKLDRLFIEALVEVWGFVRSGKAH